MDGKPALLDALATGAVAGIFATAVAGATDAALERLRTEKQKRRERAAREGSPHELAGPIFAAKLTGKPRASLTETTRRRSQRLFSLGYGVGWGLVYALARRSLPGVSRWGGFPFAVPFFLLCDGAFAPALGLTPSMEKLPWTTNAKELGNHAAWTAGAEAVHRLRGRIDR